MLPVKNMEFPAGFLESLEGITGFDKAGFENVHSERKPPVSIRFNPAKHHPGLTYPFSVNEAVPWTKQGVYLSERPLFTLNPLLHAGAYYVQEASSMFLEKAVEATGLHNQPVHVLDLCAAPGGKSTHLQSCIHPDSVLVCNEIIQQRNAVLVENITKWGASNILVTQNDPSDIGKLTDSFDLMVVDAPCSGSGLFRRDVSAMQEWSSQAVELCSQRQQRILADVLPALKPGGFLVYATCSYSKEEDEAILDWLIESFDLESIVPDWPDGLHGVVACQSPKKKATGFRFFPNWVKGEGFFIAVLQKPGILMNSENKQKGKNPRFDLPKPMMNWLHSADEWSFYAHDNRIYGMPPAVYRFFENYRRQLYIRKAGVLLAEDMHGQFVPQPAFALSHLLKQETFHFWEMEQPDAVRFLQKEPVSTLSLPKGWILAGFQGLALGWLKNMGNRSNNYYPKEWRIRMGT